MYAGSRVKSAWVLIPALPLAKLEALSPSQHLHLIRWEWQRLLSGLKDIKLLKTQHRAWHKEGTYWKQVIWTETWEKLSFRVSLRSTKFFGTPAIMPILGWIKCTCVDSKIKQPDASKISQSTPQVHHPPAWRNAAEGNGAGRDIENIFSRGALTLS